jgi:hypothetical protein
MTARRLVPPSPPTAFISKDGAQIEFLFRSPEGDVTLVLTTTQLEDLTSRLAELANEAQSRSVATQHHRAIQASRIVSAGATAPVGGGTVLLVLRGTTGIEQRFAMSVELSEKLRPVLRQAEAAARAQTKQPKQ